MHKGAAIFFTDNKSVLLLKIAGDNSDSETWCLPGGTAKEGETPHETAVREAQEETGLKKIPGSQFTSITSQNGDKTFVVYFYKVDAPFDVSLSKEHTDWTWTPLKKMASKSLHPKLEKHLDDYLDAVGGSRKSFSESLFVN